MMAGDFEGAKAESLGRALLRPTALKVIAGSPDKPLRIGDVEIPCYVLQGELRVLTRGGFLTAIGRARAVPSRGDDDKTPSFLAANNIKPFVSNDLGLLQDVGMVAMSQALGEEYARVLRRAGANHASLAANEREALGTDHAEIGAAPATAWKFPPCWSSRFAITKTPTAPRKSSGPWCGPWRWATAWPTSSSARRAAGMRWTSTTPRRRRGSGSSF